MVTKGDILHSVFFLHSGSAQAVTRDDKGQETLVALYNATDQDVAMLPSHVARGCIIGGTALVDGTLAGWPDANTATLHASAHHSAASLFRRYACRPALPEHGDAQPTHEVPRVEYRGVAQGHA